MAASRRTAAADRAAVGLLLPTRDAVVSGRGPTDVLTMAERAETAGYDSVWVGDSVVARPRYDPMTVLTAVAARTRRLRLGTAVLIPVLRHPVLVAHTVASLDQFSGGRVVLGVGAGPAYGPGRKEFATLDVPFDRRHTRLVEAIKLAKLLWGGARVDFDGEFYKVRNVELGPRPAQPGGPPVWLGAKGPLGRCLAATDFDGWFPGPASAGAFAADLAEVRSLADAADRDAGAVAGAVYVTATICADDDAASRAAARRAIEDYYRQPYELVANLHDSYLGDGAGAARWLAGYVQAGACHLVVRLLGSDPIAQSAQLAPYLDGIRRGMPDPIQA